MRVLAILIKLIFHHRVLFACVSCNQCSRGLLNVKLRGLMVGRFEGLKLRSTKVEICAFRHVAVPQLQLRPTAEIVSPSVRLKVMILPAIGSLQFSVRS